ncbi:MAG: hypothetical protein IH999_05660 [Proteobacteria bacterium]|nr:hypothetical protein [Pseudomonadota bacterium]
MPRATQRRAGTQFVAEIKGRPKNVRLIPFKFSVVQAYTVEAGEQYCRFYKNKRRWLLEGVKVVA